MQMKNHPTVEQIYEKIRTDHPNISLATVYKVLEIFVEKGLIQSVMTGSDIKMFDPVTEPHHHIHHTDSDVIRDYFDDELNDLLKSYFSKKRINNLEINEIKVHIFGRTSSS